MRLQRLLRNLAFQDLACLAFHSYLTLRIFCAPDSADAQAARPFALGLLLATTLVVALVRLELMPQGLVRGIGYRLLMIALVVLSYFELRHLLPGLQRPLLDAQMLRLDQRLFGVTPALWLDQFVRPATVEWFSFFYYSYFTLVGLHVIGSSLLDRGRRQQEILLGTMLITIIGHVLYTVFPGVGPVATMRFPHELQGGLFFGLVLKAVASAGAMMDIFPSLHTAHPTFLTLHSLRHRAEAPYRYTWPITAFFNANILVATVLLRWHYGIDLLAGLLLALLAQRLAIVISRRESTRPQRGLQPVWEPLP